jgi:hypothetical protein
MLADNDMTAVRWGGSSTSPLLRFINTNLDTANFIAEDSDFNAIGEAPGISDDGNVVAFVADHKTQGFGIFVSIFTSGDFTPIKIVGIGNNFTNFSLQFRVGINLSNTDSATEYTLAYIGFGPTGKLGLYTTTIDITNPLSPTTLKTSCVVEVEDEIDGLGGTVNNIKVYDPINNSGQVAFWVSTTIGDQAIVIAKLIPSFMLTFDDGPKQESTPYILDQLLNIKKADKTPVKAGFFLLGKDKTLAPIWRDVWQCNFWGLIRPELCPDPGVDSNPTIVQRIHQEGHFIGIHTQHHPDLAELKSEDVEKEILDCYDTIVAAGVPPAKRFRSPFLSDPEIPSDSTLQVEWKKIGGDLVGDAIPFISEESVISNCKKKMEQATKYPVCLIFHDFRGLPGHRFNFVHIVNKLVEAGYQIVDFDHNLVSENLNTISSNTPPGKNILVILPSYNTVQFSEVTTKGNTDTTIMETGPSLPAGYIAADNFFDVTTNALYSGPVTVTFSYNDSGLSKEQEENLSLMHLEDSTWIDVTKSADANNNVVTGQVDTLSMFVITIQGYDCEGDFDGDGDVDGSDLSTYAQGNTGISLDDFAFNFGRTYCTPLE